MKRRVLVWSLAVLIPALLPARITARAGLLSDTFLQYEPVRFQVTIKNDTRMPITFGGPGANSTVSMRVMDTEGDLISRTGQQYFDEPWTIGPKETATKTFNLGRLFRIQASGNYRLETVGRFPDDVALEDKVRLFRIVSGVEVDERKVKRKDRTFTLVSLNRNRREELMMRISNHNETKVYQTYFLGPYLKFYRPTFEVGTKEEVAVLHHASPTEIVFSLFKTSGQPVRKRTLPTTASDPVRLVEDEELGFVVRGVQTTSMEEEEEE